MVAIRFDHSRMRTAYKTCLGVEFYYYAVVFCGSEVGSTASSTLTLAWPAICSCWIFQIQSNSLIVNLTSPANTWYDIRNTANLTSTNFSVIPANPTVFCRLQHP